MSRREIDASNVHCPDGLNLQLDGGIYIAASQVRSADLTLVYHEGRLTLGDAKFDSPATIATATSAHGKVVSLATDPGLLNCSVCHGLRSPT